MQQRRTTDEFGFKGKKRYQDGLKCVGRYPHLHWNRCIDSSGNSAFRAHQLYTCTQVADSGYCSYLEDGEFRCDSQLLRYEYKLCSNHYRKCSEQKRHEHEQNKETVCGEKPMTKDVSVPFYLREKTKSEPINMSQIITDWQQRQQEMPTIAQEKLPPPPLVKTLKSVFNEEFVIDDATEQAIELLVAALFM